VADPVNQGAAALQKEKLGIREQSESSINQILPMQMHLASTKWGFNHTAHVPCD
jgi:hypothetical protein